MGKKEPLVSVIVPTFNRRSLVSRAIQSVLDQTYKNFEIIVVDDGSKDGTSREVMKFMKLHKNVHYFYKDNGGCASALNYGVKHSSGELVSWLSSDDWFEPDMLQYSVAAHLKNPKLGITYTSYNAVTKNTETLRESYQPKDAEDGLKKIHDECFINGSSMMVKREVFFKIGPFNENFKYAQDYDFYYRVLHDYPVEWIKRPLLNYWDSSENENDPAWLGKEVFGRTHTNEGEPVRERYKLMYEKGRQTVCAVLCVKNEEELITQCLDDLTMYIDYIVIFNDGSTDRTAEIIKKYPKVVEVYNAPPKTDARTEGKDRQRMLEMAKKTGCGWIFMVDCDEVMDDEFKTEIWKEIKNPAINLYHYLSYNFWRNRHQYRVDELWFIGWFGKLYRNLPGLKYATGINEHCGSVPCNIPGAPQWFDPSKSLKSAKSKVRIKHYGYADWNRVEMKYLGLMVRDAKPPEGRHARYDRMVTEEDMVRKEWVPKVYYVKDATGAVFLDRAVLQEEAKKIIARIEKDANEKTSKEFTTYVVTEPSKKKKVLFIGVGNCCRSLMAHIIAQQMGFDAESCGTEVYPHVYPLTEQVMNEAGMSAKDFNFNKLGDKSRRGWDVVVVMKPNLAGYMNEFLNCKKVTWHIKDPSEWGDLSLDVFKLTRDDIKKELEALK